VRGHGLRARRPTPARAPAPARLHDAETEPAVSLLGPLPDPTPPRRRLAPVVGRQLLALAEARRVDWALLLADARTHARGSMQAIALRDLKPLARSLAAAAARRALTAGSAVSDRPGKRERVVAGYYRAVGIDALISGLTAAKPVLAARVLRDPRILIYPAGRDDVAAGRVDVRVLALLLYLAQAQGEVSVASLVSGHQGPAGPQGSSAHRYGLAVDISGLADLEVQGHQQPGGRIDGALRALRLLPAEVRPVQVISLLDLGPDSLALADHGGYVHLSYAVPVTHDAPADLRALWQSAGARYDIPWQILGAINKIETDNGRVLGTSSAGAVGWMQFLPSTWRQYGTDGDGDGIADPLDPADAIYSAARYLQAAGAGTDLRRAIYAYNHAPWYVRRVLAQARTYH
jgi:Transglycosylase SLT domain